MSVCGSTCQGMPCERSAGHAEWHVYFNADDDWDDGPLEWSDSGSDEFRRAGATWHGARTGMSAAEFRAWRWWMIEHQPSLYFAWARVLARQEVVVR